MEQTVGGWPCPALGSSLDLVRDYYLLLVYCGHSRNLNSTMLMESSEAGLGIVLNEQAGHLKAPKALLITPNATHFFAEPAALEAVSRYPVRGFRLGCGPKLELERIDDVVS